MDKTKIMVFNRKRREKKERWKWERRDLEEVQSVKYLGYFKQEWELYKSYKGLM